MLKLTEDTKAGIEDLIPAAIVITVLVVLFSVIPIIGYNVDTSVTIPTTGTGAQWNSGVNTAITNGSELWATNSPLLSLAVLIGIIFTAIGMLLTQGGKVNGGGGL